MRYAVSNGKGSKIKNSGYAYCYVMSMHNIWEYNPKGFQGRPFVTVRTLRAFRRRLRQWKDCLPKGTQVMLVSWGNNHVIGVIR